MKSKDYETIIIVAVISGVLSIFISSKIFVPPSQRQQSVTVVPSISADFPTTPLNSYLNTSSIDPTVTVQIGTQPNSNPGVITNNKSQ